MEIKFDLKTQDTDKVGKKIKKIKKEQYEPTWEEVWDIGYDNKRPIMSMKNSDSDLRKLLEVRRAIECEDLGMGLESLRKATKTYFLGLYEHLQQQQKSDKLKQLIADKPGNYKLITESKDLRKLCALLHEEHIIALDTETTGLNWEHGDKIVGISMTLPRADKHFYIPIRHIKGMQLPMSVVKVALKPFLEDRKLQKVLHNAKFDYHMFMREGIQLKGITGDTMTIMFILNENEKSYSLKNLVSRHGSYFGFDGPQEDYDTLFGRVGFDTVPIDAGMVYACKDTHMTWELYKWQMTFFKKNPKLKDLYNKVELPLLQVICDMEQAGLPIDFEFAKQYGEELGNQVAEMKSKLTSMLYDINIDSNTQLAKVLYDIWKVKPPKKGRTVDAETLKALSEEHPVLNQLLEYRELSKLYSTYILPLPQKVGYDRRLHGQFKQMGARTGRFASASPNLQNIPVAARPLIKAPGDRIIIGIDFSAIEPRLLAHLSGDTLLKQPFIDGEDLYSTVAANLFDLPIEQCGDGSKYRKMIKVGILATMYGTSKFTLAKQLGIDPEEAEQFIKDFLDRYWGVKLFIESTHGFVNRNEYVETMMGRKRRFPGHRYVAETFEYDDSYAVDSLYHRVTRQGVNAVIQGSASDLMKLAMVKVHQLLNRWGSEYIMLATIHDEILIEVPESITLEQVDAIEDAMTSVFKLSVPLKVDTAIMYSWGKEISKKEWFSE